jgi:2-aminoadipate transaminase
MLAIPNFSTRVGDLHPSPIREILSIANRPGMISFAGGLPSPETFPALDLAVPPATLQYGATEGEPALRQRIARELRDLGLECGADQILILSGSQQGIDLVAKLFIDPGTSVAVESPTYLAALQVFRFFGARFAALPPEGINSDFLAREKPAFAYAIPTFQNPTGHCYTAAQREAFAAACDGAGVTVFEDDPYRDLAFDPCDRQPICARLKKAPWIYQGSFSKSLAPGLRLGFLAASPELLPFLVRLKQAADLHSNRLSQWLVLNQLEHPGREGRLAGLVDTYRRKRDSFARSLERHFGSPATWDTPKGGLFFWLKLNRPLDTRRLLQPALERGVAFMPGEPFHPLPNECGGTLRLNFSHAGEAEAERGLEVLAELFGQAPGA